MGLIQGPSGQDGGQVKEQEANLEDEFVVADARVAVGRDLLGLALDLLDLRRHDLTRKKRKRVKSDE